MAQPQAKNIWHFIENSVDDFGNGLVVGVLVAGYGVYWLGDKAAEALRPVFGQSSGEVVIAAGIATVTAAGVTYVIRKRKGGGDNGENGSGGNGRHPNQPNPQPPILERIFNLVQRRQLTAAMPPDTAVLEQAAQETRQTVAMPNTRALDESWELMDRIREAEHILIVAGTRAGKTVFMTAVMQQVIKHGGKYFVLDGKPEGDWDQKWPNAAGKIKDPARFPVFMQAAVAMLEKRKAHGAAQFPALYLVLDETQNITGKYEEVEDAVAKISSEGAAFNMHVWLATQAATVKQVGFDGRLSVVEHNFQPVYMEHDGYGRSFSYAKFRNGSIYPYDVRYPTPNLPAPWADVSHLPMYDDSREFGEFHPVQRPLPLAYANGTNGNGTAVLSGANGGVLAGANGGASHSSVEYAPVHAPAPVQNAPVGNATATDRINAEAQRMIDTMTDESDYPNGKGFLTIGEALAIFYLSQNERSRNEICSFVLGIKNPQRMAAIGGVLGELSKQVN